MFERFYTFLRTWFIQVENERIAKLGNCIGTNRQLSTWPSVRLVLLIYGNVTEIGRLDGAK